MVQYRSVRSPILTFEINQKQISKCLACLLISLYLCNAFEMQLRVWAAGTDKGTDSANDRSERSHHKQ